MEGLERKLLEIIATKVIQGDSLEKMTLPEPFGTVRWTGWKETSWSLEKHGQIFWVIPSKTGQILYYVDLPSMKHGRSKLGHAFNVEMEEGVAHFYGPNNPPTLENVREWFIEGFTLLLRDVLEDNPWIVDVPMKEKV